MPFTNAYHGAGTPEPRTLGARIEAELRARIVDAVDYACLDAMVRARQARAAPHPVADARPDRDEFERRVSAFLEELRVAMTAALTDDQRRRLGDAVACTATNVDAALGAQVALAKVLPDYWQRFDDVRSRSDDAAQASRGERRGRLLDRLLGRG